MCGVGAAWRGKSDVSVSYSMRREWRTWPLPSCTLDNFPPVDSKKLKPDIHLKLGGRESTMGLLNIGSKQNYNIF